VKRLKARRRSFEALAPQLPQSLQQVHRGTIVNLREVAAAVASARPGTRPKKFEKEIRYLFFPFPPSPSATTASLVAVSSMLISLLAGICISFGASGTPSGAARKEIAG
jgi:hypothetical protein